MPLLVLGNKQDLYLALDYAELERRLALQEVRGRQWRLQCAHSRRTAGGVRVAQ